MAAHDKLLGREIDIRLKVVEHILQNHPQEPFFIAVEPQYGPLRRRADILLVSNELHAFEIKSDVDSLARLDDQLEDYKRTFDFVTVVTTAKHIDQVLKKARGKEGVILFQENELETLRGPRKNEKISKQNLVSMCSKDALARLLRVTEKSLTLEQAKKHTRRAFTVQRLKDAVREELRRRFELQFQTFLSEATIPLAESDLSMLRCYDRLEFA